MATHHERRTQLTVHTRAVLPTCAGSVLHAPSTAELPSTHSPAALLVPPGAREPVSCPSTSHAPAPSRHVLHGGFDLGAATRSRTQAQHAQQQTR